jgi:2,4-dienoyl-CoA reductase-like NADH-dependent reductase (Old Yellow Enzyme family)
MTRYQALLQPFQLKGLRLRNRVMSTSHEPAYAEHGRPGLRYRLYHEEKARGGIALTMIGGSAVVAPDAPPAFGNLRLFGGHRVTITLNRRLRRVRREGNRLAAILYDEYARATEERLVDQVVIEHGTMPADELYFELKPRSSNLGETDLDALLAGRPQTKVNNPGGSFRLLRVGDAVASRNIHAAIYDSLRLCKDL